MALPPESEWSELPKSAKAARAEGATWFFSGKVCRNGHKAPRYSTSMACVLCDKAQRRKRVSHRRATKESRQLDEAKRAKVEVEARAARVSLTALERATAEVTEALGAPADAATTVALIERKLNGLFAAMTPEKLAEAKLNTLASAAGTLIDRLQLLKGLPTEIVSVERREKLEALAPKLLAEMQRRGMTVDLASSEYREVEGGR